MKLFKCNHCDQLLFFENSRCENCGYELGFVAETLQLLPLLKTSADKYKIYGEDNGREYRYCDNHNYSVCNWIIPENNKTLFCRACELNRTIPDLSKNLYTERWQVLENGKHRLIFSILQMGLPLISKHTNAKQGLLFDFMADESKDKRVLTGHDDGLITINIAEADDIEREMARKAMAEVYRTVLGHFRHEVGHYYWDILIDNSPYLEEFRNLFGDERADYGEALKVHYKQGPPLDWQKNFISSYASTHPWEDWAETWAHYLHILDTLQTAYSFGISVQPGIVEPTAYLNAEIKVDPYNVEDINQIMNLWFPLSFAMNSLNRSMGQRDPYPFVIGTKVIEKLSFIHKVCYNSGNKRMKDL